MQPFPGVITSLQTQGASYRISGFIPTNKQTNKPTIPIGWGVNVYGKCPWYTPGEPIAEYCLVEVTFIAYVTTARSISVYPVAQNVSDDLQSLDD